MGALEFIPPVAEEMEKPFKVEIANLHRLACAALNEAKDFNTEMQSDYMIESLFKVGTSPGGRRAKAIIHVNRETNECYSGLVNVPASGFASMLTNLISILTCRQHVSNITITLWRGTQGWK